MKCSVLVYLFLFFCLISCSESKKHQITRMTKEWSGKEILFPEKMEFSLYGKELIYDTIPNSEYKIITYIDSLGCASCKLRLSSWKSFIHQLDVMDLDVPILFFLHPFDSRSLKAILRRDKFNYPVCMDTKDQLNQINHFPTDFNFQTFLVDRDNKVVAIGNPVHNPQIKELYLNILTHGKQRPMANETKVAVQSFIVDLGTFWQTRRDTIVYVKNVGNEKLMILDVVASCGCTLVDYDKQPVLPGDSLAFNIVYNVDKKGYFSKTINIYCNIAASPIQFHVEGNAK